MTTPNTDLTEQLRTYLEEVGLTDRPEQYGDGIHGWRCELPDLYGRCDCLDNVVADLVKLMEAAVKRGQAEAWERGVDDGITEWENDGIAGPNPYEEARNGQ